MSEHAWMRRWKWRAIRRREHSNREGYERRWRKHGRKGKKTRAPAEWLHVMCGHSKGFVMGAPTFVQSFLSFQASTPICDTTCPAPVRFHLACKRTHKSNNLSEIGHCEKLRWERERAARQRRRGADGTADRRAAGSRESRKPLGCTPSGCTHAGPARPGPAVVAGGGRDERPELRGLLRQRV